MLPDFPELKKRLQRLVNRRLRASFYRESGIIAEVPHFSIKEGDGWTIVRADGSQESSNFQEMSSEMTIDTKDLPTLSPEELIARLDSTAKDMARKASGVFFGTLKEATASSGNVIDAKGRPLSPYVLLETLERMQIDFKDDGSHTDLRMIVGPELYKSLQAKIPEWDKDENFKRLHAELMERKREEWRLREARRKLVD